MRIILIITLLLCIFTVSCGNIKDSDGEIGNESKETADTEDIIDRAEEIVDDMAVASSESSAVRRITTEQAQSVAFSDAGFAPGEVTVYKSYLYNDNGRCYYDVEFADKETMFGYEIDSVSGDILKKELFSIK